MAMVTSSKPCKSRKQGMKAMMWHGVFVLRPQAAQYIDPWWVPAVADGIRQMSGTKQTSDCLVLEFITMDICIFYPLRSLC